jgi:hypothetical protein
MRRVTGLAFSALLVTACASHHQEQARLDDSGLAQLNEDQMQPVDQARLDLGRAQDAVSKTRANEADARARIEVAKSEREVNVAQVKRAAAQRDLLKRQYADRDAMAQGDRDIAAAQEDLRATDLKLQYLSQKVSLSASERSAAEARVQTQETVVEQAKYQAMQQAGAPQIASINPGELDARLAQARAKQAQLERETAEHRTQAMASYNRWQQAAATSRAQEPTGQPAVAVPAAAPQQPR